MPKFLFMFIFVSIVLFAQSEKEKLQKQLEAHLKKVDALSEKLQVPDFPKNKEWFNTSSLSFKRELKGKITILDFWTYCCINCIHVLPDLKALEKKYAGHPVAFVGVHSAKFDNEKVSENIRNAILRYEIEHSVVNDDQMYMWRQLGVRSWPTFVIIGPKNNILLLLSGEGNREVLDLFIATALKYYKNFNHTPIPVKLEKSQSNSPLRFPGKLAIDAKTKRLFISDSNHHRVVVTDLNGKFIENIGSGRRGLQDGSFATAQFNLLQGLTYFNNKLYVADAENHALREIDFISKQVKTLAGIGRQGYDYQGGKKIQALSTPWDLAKNNDILYIAMAGTHQIWQYSLKTKLAKNYSGNGSEQNFNSTKPLEAAWAQPSGLTIGLGQLFIADSESSTIRAIDLKTGSTATIVGGEDKEPRNLFAFGDQDGAGEKARLQHPLGVLWLQKQKRVLVADTYNHRLKLLDPKKESIVSWVGSGQAGFKDDIGLKARFSEPSGFALSPDGNKVFVADTNNHVIRIVDIATKTTSTLQLTGIPKPLPKVAPRSERLADLATTKTIKISPVKIVANGKGEFILRLKLPQEHYYTSEAMSRWQILNGSDNPLKVVQKNAAGLLKEGEIKIPFAMKEKKSGSIQLEALAYYCGADGLCKVGSIVFEVPFVLGKKQDVKVVLEYEFKE